MRPPHLAFVALAGPLFKNASLAGDPAQIRGYEEDLYPSSDAYHAPCTAKATIYCAAGLASLIGATISAHINNRRPAGIIIDFRNMQLLGGAL